MGYTLTAYAVVCLAFFFSFSIYASLQSFTRLKHVPGPLVYALTRYRLAYDAWKARSIHKIRALHQKHGAVVRVGPNQVSFNSLSALRTIYGAGSGFERTSFYRMFDGKKTALSINCPQSVS